VADTLAESVKKCNSEDPDTRIAGCTALLDTGTGTDMARAKAYAAIATAYSAKQDYKKALKNFTEAVRLEPNYADIYYARGNSYLEQSRFDKAIADYDTALRLKPGYVQAYNNRGFAHGAKHENDQAVADYSTAIRLDPKNPGAYYGRAVAYGAKNQYDKAITDLDEAISIKPDGSMYYLRSLARQRQGDKKGAEADMKKAKALGFAPGGG
jgi:tetratricopeptide (TPR) repeat protein